MSDAQINEAARLFSILSEHSRLRLLRALMDRPAHGHGNDRGDGMKQGNVSKHLGVLLTARFVARASGRENFARYCIADKNVYKLCDVMCCRMEEEARRVAEEFGVS